jgi:hypothetical protein
MSARSNIYRLAVLGLLHSRAPRSVQHVVAFMLLGVVIAVMLIVLGTLAHSEEAARYWPSYQVEQQRLAAESIPTPQPRPWQRIEEQSEAEFDAKLAGTPRERECARRHLQDGEVAEDKQQQADYYRCVDRAPKRVQFRPWNAVWQCNDIRVTQINPAPGIVRYDLGGTIWGGSQFVLNLNNGALFFNGRACQPVRPR